MEYIQYIIICVFELPYSSIPKISVQHFYGTHIQQDLTPSTPHLHT